MMASEKLSTPASPRELAGKSCCAAVEKAIGASSLGRAAALASTRELIIDLIGSGLLTVSELQNRQGVLEKYLTMVDALINASFIKLSTLIKRCQSECCSGAADGLRDLSIGHATNGITVAYSPLITGNAIKQNLDELTASLELGITTVFNILEGECICKCRKHRKD
jgi:hypothetical protein